MTSKRVELVVYEDEHGNLVSASQGGTRKVIGEAVVDLMPGEDGLMDVSGTIQDDDFKFLLSDRASYSLNVGPCVRRRDDHSDPVHFRGRVDGPISGS